MNRFLTIITLLMLLAYFALSQTPGKAGDRLTGLQQQLLQVENERIRGLVHNDFAALDQILSDDLIYTHSTGVAETKADYLGQLKSGQLKYQSMEHEGVVVRVYGDTAILTGRTKVRSVSRGQEFNNDLRFIIVYVKQRGRWRMVSWQSTRISS